MLDGALINRAAHALPITFLVKSGFDRRFKNALPGPSLAHAQKGIPTY